MGPEPLRLPPSAAPANGSPPAMTSSTDDADSPPSAANPAHTTPSASACGGSPPLSPLPVSVRISQLGWPADAACEDSDADIVEAVGAGERAEWGGGDLAPVVPPEGVQPRVVEDVGPSGPRESELAGAATLAPAECMAAAARLLWRWEQASSERTASAAAAAQHGLVRGLCVSGPVTLRERCFLCLINNIVR